jgi:7,8-dihydropterin-6-yl-methyl-4-(beta-D-ribofuranosyl)aminobenzene 5'-phosphate synthase
VRSAVEKVTITTLVDNYVDMLLPDPEHARRLGLIHHFDPRMIPPQAENGISFLVTTERRGRTRSVLFDTSLTSSVLLHNFRATDTSPADISAIVLSHGHPDHHGGLIGLLDALEHPMPVILDPAAFLPRYLRLPTGEVAPHYNYALREASIEAAGGVLSLSRGAVEVIDGVFSTGRIDREVSFEQPADQQALDAGLFHLVDGHISPDSVPDDQALVINVEGLGLVVLTGCSHAGVVNSIRAARAITGETRVHAVMGGFHLGFPGIPQAKTDATIDALREFELRVIAPMHCSGMRATMQIADAMPDQFLLNCSGTTVQFAA